jgi:HlyD family secretion protein
LIPAEKIYVVELKLPENMKTSYGKEIDFTGELTGIVEIKTENISLFMRFLNPIKHFLKQNHS